MLDGKVAIVTGGGSGIGRAIALGLAALGAKIVVNDLGVSLDGSKPSDGPARDVADAIRAAGGEAVVAFEDIATIAGGKRTIEAALDNFGRVDSLSCCAGIMRPATIFDMTEAEWDSVVAVNLKGTFAAIQPAAIAMRRQGFGAIMTYTSLGGIEGNPEQPNYAAAKEGIVGLTRAVALSIAPYATCNAICPGAATRMTDRVRPGQAPGAAERIVPLAAFLSSDHARHITGQVITINGERVSIFPQPRHLRSAFKSGGWNAEDLAAAWDGALAQDKLVRYDRFVGPKSAAPNQ